MKIWRLRHGKLLLSLFAGLSVAALAVATLWPFSPIPTNEVSWVGSEDGLRFGDYGTVFSATEFPASGSDTREPFSLEMWMEPGLGEDSNVMIAFYTPEKPGQFVLRQDESDILILHANAEVDKHAPKPLIAGEVVQQGKKTLVTVTAEASGRTTLYVNGRAKRSSPSFGLSRQNVSGEMVVGNSPVGNNTWSGLLREIAIYKKALTAEEVAARYRELSSGTDTLRADGDDLLALYRFRERAGTVIKNEVQPGVDLYIPKHYTIWRQAFLTAPWREFQATWAYAKDVLMNILGFAPLGIVLFPYFLIVRKSKHPWWMSYLSGFVLSLSVEILQAFIPTRYSGWTDVITNSTGTALGASIYAIGFFRNLVTKIFDTETKSA